MVGLAIYSVVQHLTGTYNVLGLILENMQNKRLRETWFSKCNYLLCKQASLQQFNPQNLHKCGRKKHPTELSSDLQSMPSPIRINNIFKLTKREREYIISVLTHW